MPALKALVIAMAVLIVAGLAVVVVEIATRLGTGRPEPPAAAPGTLRLAVPEGARIMETVLDGGRIALRLALPDGTARIAVYDLATGRPLADLAVEPSGGPPPAGAAAPRPGGG